MEGVFMVADDPGTRLELKGFHATLTEPASETDRQFLPVVTVVTTKMIKENFFRIVSEVEQIAQEEMKRIVSDPSLKQYIVKR